MVEGWRVSRHAGGFYIGRTLGELSSHTGGFDFSLAGDWRVFKYVGGFKQKLVRFVQFSKAIARK
jgi:hypothetical protein